MFASFATAESQSHADEGMWLPNQLPREMLKTRFDFNPSEDWVVHVQRSCVRFGNGGSASFISPDGLIMTNHHVGSDAVQHLSTEEHDYMKEGFYAPTRDGELKCPEMELAVLMSIEEVTDKVNAGVTPDMSPADAQAARKKAMAKIESDARERTRLQPEIVTLYQGARYDLYLYKRYTDVRLVMAPHFEAAFFGGDIDNFEYPRFDLDVCFFRAYEDGKPVRTEHFLQWSKKGAQDGELIICAGHPGRTQRLFTMEHLKFLRDVRIPLLLQAYNQREVELIQFSAESDEHKRIALEDLFYIQNGRKAYGGIIAGLLDAQLMQRKRAMEQSLRAFVDADPERREQYGDAWDDLAEALNRVEPYYDGYFLLGDRRAALSQIYKYAVQLVRASIEREKPDGERLEEYREANLSSLEVGLFSTAPVYTELEQLRLRDGFVRLARILGGEHPIVLTALGGQDPATRAAELLAGTRLADVEVRRKLYEGGAKAIAASDDAMIQFALELDPMARELRKRYEDEFESVQRAAYARIAQASFDKFGQSVYPDATFTLRFSFGEVAGYEELGREIPWKTTMVGAYELSKKHGNQPPYRLPPRWLERKDRLDLSTPYDFVTTNDIIGGNSGSPMINRHGEIVGIVFDGNIHGLVWDFIFDQERARSVSVHSQAIIEALDKVYDAKALVREILGNTTQSAAMKR